jgi:hypothetical protein
MKIVDLISEEQKTIVLGFGNVATFFLDTAEKFGVEEGDIVLARGVNELIFGIAHLHTYSEEKYIWTLQNVKFNFHFCNVVEV